MYYHLHYPVAEHGLQYLIFASHITPDLILMLPIYAIAQSALTLLTIQAVILSLTGLVLFFVARDLLKNDKIALVLSFAFLVNPGMHGLFVFDFHAESLLPLFMLLTFYFAVKNKKALFAVSLALFLGVMDVAALLALGLALGMGAYAILRERGVERRRWLAYTAAVFIAAAVTYALYGAVVNSLISQYRAGDYPNLPLLNMVMPFSGSQISQLLTNFAGGGVSNAYAGMGGYAGYALVIIFLGFGIALFFEPVVSLFLVSPWLVEAFLVGNSEFVFVWNQYFAFALGGMMIGAILGLKALSEHKGFVAGRLARHGAAYKYAVVSVAVLSFVIFAISPYFVYSKNVNNLSQDFLFSVNSTVKPQIGALDSVIALIPSNASVMAPFFTMPQLVNRQYFEQIPSAQDGYTPVSITDLTSP